MLAAQVHRQARADTGYAGFTQGSALVFPVMPGFRREGAFSPAMTTRVRNARRGTTYRLLNTCDQMAIMPTNSASDASAAASSITALNMVLSPERTENIVHVLFLSQVVAAYTKDIVYARLAPQILEALEQRNPIESGRRKGAHHQLLTDDVGHPALAQHLHAVVTLMRVSKSWEQFKLMLDIAHPKRNDTLQLPLMADFETDPIQRKKDEVAGFKQTSLFDAPSDLASEPLQPSLPTDSAERP